MNKPLVPSKHFCDSISTLQTTMKSDVVNGHQDVASDNTTRANVLIYDVNAGNTDFGIELCNTLLGDG